MLIHVQVPCWTEDNITIQKRSTYKRDLISFVVRCVNTRLKCWTEDNITIQKRSTYKRDIIAFVVRCVNTRLSAVLNKRQHYNTKEKYV